MIDPVFAQNFIDRLYKQLKIHINIMNERAIIIASSRPERIGSFHSCAYKILQQSLTVMVTDEPTNNLIGVTSPGVNLLLMEDARPIGVIGVSGKPENVLNVARVVRYAFEVQRQCETSKREKGFPDPEIYRFTTAMLFDPMPDAFRIATLAQSLAFSDHIPRILVKIRLNRTYDEATRMTDWSDMYLDCPFRHDQDLLLPIDPSTLLLCKVIPSGAEPKARLRGFLFECLSWLDQLFASVPGQKHIDESRYYCSTVVDSFQDYREIYHFINWVESNRDAPRNRICHVTDFLTGYLIEQLPENKARPILGYFAHLVDQYPGKDLFIATIGALIETGFSTDAAARMLYVHKNTVVTRLRKIRDTLGLGENLGFEDRVLLTSIYHYLQKEDHSA